MPFEDPNKIGALVVGGWRPRLDVSARSDFGQPPDAQLAVARARDDERLRRHHDSLAILEFSGGDRHDDLQAAHSRRVSEECLGADALLNVPDANGPIRTTRHERVAFVLKRPDTSLVALKLGTELAGVGVVDVDKSVIAAGDDFVFIKLQARNDVAGMGSKCHMARLDLATRPAESNHVVASVKGLEEMQFAQAWEANLWVRHRKGCGARCRIRAFRLVDGCK